MIDGALRELERRLAEHGVRGRPARRLLNETREHLRDAAAEAGEGEAVRRFGDLELLARQVAAEVATAGTRTATFVAFAALSAAGLGYASVLALVPAAGGWQDITGGRLGTLGPLVATALVLLPQIAFVAGCLALTRALRLRHVPAASSARLGLLRRRAGVALGAALGTYAALAAFAFDSGGQLASWWVASTVAVTVLASALLAGAGVALARSARAEAVPGGPAGDVFDDLDPLFRWEPVARLSLPEHPWRLAAGCAGAVFVLGLAGGLYAEGDPGSGLERGAFEAVALLICFAALGRVLGLRRASG